MKNSISHRVKEGVYLWYLVSFAVCLSRDVTGEDLKDTFLVHQLLPPHFQQRIFGRLALQVEEVVVVELAKSWRRRVAPGNSPNRSGSSQSRLNRNPSSVTVLTICRWGTRPTPGFCKCNSWVSTPRRWVARLRLCVWDVRSRPRAKVA